MFSYFLCRIRFHKIIQWILLQGFVHPTASLESFGWPLLIWLNLLLVSSLMMFMLPNSAVHPIVFFFTCFIAVVIGICNIALALICLLDSEDEECQKWIKRYREGVTWLTQRNEQLLVYFVTRFIR